MILIVTCSLSDTKNIGEHTLEEERYVFSTDLLLKMIFTQYRLEGIPISSKISKIWLRLIRLQTKKHHQVNLQHSHKPHGITG
jgi:hypothetical protein